MEVLKMNSKSLAKQFLAFRQVEKINELVEEQMLDAEQESFIENEPEVKEKDFNTLRLDQIIGN
jgi:hypothetical protein